MRVDNVGMAIRQEREQQGLTRAMLAGRAGLTKKVIENIERASYSPTLQQLNAVSAALNIDLIALLKRADSAAHENLDRPPAPYTMTVREASARLGRPRTTVASLVRSGRLPAVKYGWRVYVDARAVEREHRLRAVGRR